VNTGVRTARRKKKWRESANAQRKLDSRKDLEMGLAHEKLKNKLAGSRTFGWKPKNGDNRIFVLPPASEFVTNLDGVEGLAWEFRGHYFRIEGRQGEATRCLQDLGQKCPACAAWKAFSNSADPGLKDMAKQVRPAVHYVFNIIDLTDPAKGVQRWGANWTCWTKIMEIAADPSWGYVYDPKNGVAFVVALTPGNQSKTGHNSYSVRPERQPLTVEGVFAANPEGYKVLDGIEEAAMEAKTAEEIITLLGQMGFPGYGNAPVAPVGATPVTFNVPPAVTTPMPVSPVVVPMTTAPGPTPVLPTAAPLVIPNAAPLVVPISPIPGVQQIQPTQPAGVHYDPGAAYVEKVPEGQRPANAPRCFSDYRPDTHQCRPCPVQSECKMKFLGIV